MKWIDPARVHRAILALHTWWLGTNTQASKHLMPLLALLEAGAGRGDPVRFEERPHEYDFWDRHFRLHGNETKPYINPILRKRAEANFPHSNAATIRKNTFQNRWNAAVLEQGENGEAIWRLNDDYADIYRSKGLVRSGDFNPVPVVDLAALTLRDLDFPDDATARTLEERFRERFPQRDEDYDRMFRFVNEDPDQLFTAERPAAAAYADALQAALIEDVQAPPADTPGEPEPDPRETEEDDEITSQVRELLSLGSSGVILRGIPGTGKTYHAQLIARKLVRDPDRDVFRVQFHPSYGYEDFVEGYKPDADARSGFAVVDKVFLDACERARQVQNGDYVVLIIDEINRGDPARVFGEVLTYIERGYRVRTFSLPYSGKKTSVPANLVVLGTMNPHDRSIALLDAAFIRRFDYIDVKPSSEKMTEFLERETASFEPEQIDRVRTWFEALQRMIPNGLGHTYFKDVRRPAQLQLVWRYRMLPACEAALETEPRKLQNVIASFDAMYADVIGQERHGED